MTDPIEDGMRRAGRSRGHRLFDVAPYVRAKMGPDVAACRDAIRPELALYIGGMGARTKNFYNDLAIKLGYAEAARERAGPVSSTGKRPKPPPHCRTH